MEVKATLEGPNAGDLLKRAPEKLLRLLEDRETVVISTLAQSESALVIERIRDQYKERVFRNVAYSIDLLNDASYFVNLLDNARGVRSVDIDKVEKHHELLSDYLLPHLTSDLKKREALLAGLFKHLNIHTRKVSVLISNITLKSMLQDLQEFYKNTLETQETKDGRAGKAYYLNEAFAAEWRKRARNLEERITKNPFDVPGYKEATFYGLEERLIRGKMEIVRESLTELNSLLAKKPGKEALNKFYEKAKLKYLYMREMLLVVPAIDSETSFLIKGIVSNDNMPKKETLKEWVV